MQKMRLLLSLIIVALTMGGMVGITGAFFSSEAKSIQNLFSSGSMEIVLTDLNGWRKTRLLRNAICLIQSGTHADCDCRRLLQEHLGFLDFHC